MSTDNSKKEPSVCENKCVYFSSINGRFEGIENFVDESLKQIVLPEFNSKQAGHLGQWGDEDSAENEYSADSSNFSLQKYGHTDVITSKSRNRSVMNVFVSQLSLLNHPYLNAEELLSIELRQLYSHYRTLLSNKVIWYYSTRVITLANKLVESKAKQENLNQRLRVKSAIATGEEDEESSELNLSQLRTFYLDFTETLPMLFQTIQMTSSLSEELYSKWRALKQARTVQGFVCTRVNLVARPLGVVVEEEVQNEEEKEESKDDAHRPLLNKNNMSKAPRNASQGLAALHASREDEISVFNDLCEVLSNADLIPAMRFASNAIVAKESESISSDAMVEDSDNPLKNREKLLRAASSSRFKKFETKFQTTLEKLETIITEIKNIRSISKRNATSGTAEEKAMNGGLFPNFVFQLSLNGVITPDNVVSVIEVKRRFALANTEVFMRLKVNDEVLSGQEIRALLHYPALTVSVNKNIELHVYHTPHSLSLDVYMRIPGSSIGDLFAPLLPCDWISMFIANVPIPLSSCEKNVDSQASMVGSAKAYGKLAALKNMSLAANISPLSGWLHFSSAQEISMPVISSGGVWTSALSSSVARLVVEPKLIQGAVFCRVDFSLVSEHHRNPLAPYEGIPKNDWGFVPEHGLNSNVHGISGQAALYLNARGNFNKSFSLENDFRRLLPRLDDIDIYDPKNGAVVRILESMSHDLVLRTDKDRDIFRLFGDDYACIFGEEGTLGMGRSLLGSGGDSNRFIGYNNFFRLTASNRMKLIALRDYKPFLFTGPIPATEQEIKQSELYRTILNSIPEDKPVVLPAFTVTGTQGAAGLSASSSGKFEGVRKSASGRLMADYNYEDESSERESVLDNFDGANNKTKVTSFLQRVREINNAVDGKKKSKFGGGVLSTASVVSETDYSIRFGQLRFENIIPERVRSLKPTPKVRIPQSIQVDNCSVLAQIVGCRNVPLRFAEKAVVPNVPVRSIENAKGHSLSSNLKNLEEELDVNAETDAVLALIDLDKRREQRRVRTFIEVSFQENRSRTTAEDGHGPQWKQSVVLPFRPPQNDFAPSRLQQVRDVVYFTLFDEIEEDDSYRGGLVEGESGIRLEKRYLGHFALPFATLYEEGRIEGTFRLNAPCFNFGYTQQSPVLPSTTYHVPFGSTAPSTGATSIITCLTSCFYSPPPDANEEARSAGIFLNPKTKNEFEYYASDDTATYVKLMVTLDPLLVTPKTAESPDDFIFPNVSHDDRYLATYATSWLKTLKELGAHTKNRNYTVFCSLSSSQQVFVCRFLCPLAPPTLSSCGVDGEASPDKLISRRACIHLLTMLPFLPDSQVFLSDIDLWCTANQCFDMGCGDEEEHAVLLRNYLHYLALKEKGLSTTDKPTDSRIVDYLTEVFIVTGKALPEGENTVYVLLRDRNVKSTPGSANFFTSESFILINPCTGHVFSAADPNCPLQDIYSVISPSNVYANIQVATNPNTISFDFDDTTAWKSFFHANFEYPKAGLVALQSPVRYFETSTLFALDVEKAVSQAIKGGLRRWRSHRLNSMTTFHPDASSVLYEVLSSLEDWKRNGPEGYLASRTDLAPTIVNTNGASFRRVKGAASRKDINDTVKGSSMEIVQEMINNKLKHLLKTRKLGGYPLNMPFLDIEDLLEKVKAMGIHETKHPEVQFVVAVRAFPLVNNLVSLWVFLGTLETQKQT